MPAIKRSANVVWEGTIARGGGQLVYTITTSELDVVGRVAGVGEAASSARHTKRSRPALSHVRSREISRSVFTAVSRTARRRRVSR
jgi:hypothetical protein